MGLYDFTIYDLIKRNALCFRDRPAWCESDDSRTLTFAQYRDKVDNLASGLRESGFKKGERIGVLAKNSLEYFLLYGAAAALGAVMLPVNWRLSADEVCFNLNDCEPKALFVDRENQGLIEGLKGKLTSVEKHYNLSREGGNYPGFDSLMKSDSDFEPADINSDDGFVIIHTAAVAGRPGGALLSHGNVLCADMHFNYFFGLTPRDVHLNILPFFHVGGLFMAMTSFHAGALNINVNRFDANDTVRLIQEKRVSVMMAFSPVLSSILEEQEKTGMDISSFRIATGLDTPETIEKYQNVTGGTYYSIYGQTETSSMATFGPYDERPGAAGRVIPLAEVRLVDDYERPVPMGQVGEIAMRGPMVFKGYYNRPEENAYTFRNRWHHTGDLGRFDEDGFLWYEGRKAEKELIKPGGENVYPAEVEKVILQHPAVEKAVVFGVPDPRWKEGIKAVCQLKEGDGLEPRELIDFVGERIARFKRPQYIEFVTDIPLLEDGSPDRVKIKELYGGEQ